MRSILLTLGQGLSAHLQVPLPYLLYRAQVRYEEDLRGLQDIRSTLNTSNSLATRHSEGGRQDERPSSAHALPPRDASRLASSIRQRTPISPSQRPSSRSTLPHRLAREHGSATLTLSHKPGVMLNEPPPRASSPASSQSSVSSDEAIDKAEEEERRQEEQEAVGRRLKELEKLMSGDMLGFARPPRIQPMPGPSTAVPRSPLREPVQRGDSASESTSISPQGSIPSIPSPPPESSSSQALSATPASATAASPALLSPLVPRSQHYPRRGVGVRARPSQRGSSHGSSASSFSDMSDAASISASALESALMSNIRGGGSRL